MLSGDELRDTTFMPEEWADAMSAIVSNGPPSDMSSQLSASVRTPSIPNDVAT